MRRPAPHDRTTAGPQTRPGSGGHPRACAAANACGAAAATSASKTLPNNAASMRRGRAPGQHALPASRAAAHARARAPHTKQNKPGRAGRALPPRAAVRPACRLVTATKSHRRPRCSTMGTGNARARAPRPQALRAQHASRTAHNAIRPGRALIHAARRRATAAQREHFASHRATRPPRGGRTWALRRPHVMHCGVPRAATYPRAHDIKGLRSRTPCGGIILLNRRQRDGISG